MRKPKFKKGARCEVVTNHKRVHLFHTGEHIEVLRFDPADGTYWCRGERLRQWVPEQDLELLKDQDNG